VRQSRPEAQSTLFAGAILLGNSRRISRMLSTRQARMPAKNPVVVTTPRRCHQHEVVMFSAPAKRDTLLEPMIPKMIRAAGTYCCPTGSCDTLPFKSRATGPQQKSLLGVLETQCRHIDYVITGRFRSSRSLNGSDLTATDSIDTNV
jgi:hypothetical protein